MSQGPRAASLLSGLTARLHALPALTEVVWCPRMFTLNDLWRLDVMTWTWERLQPLGLQPCPRMQAGKYSCCRPHMGLVWLHAQVSI